MIQYDLPSFIPIHQSLREIRIRNHTDLNKHSIKPDIRFLPGMSILISDSFNHIFPKNFLHQAEIDDTYLWISQNLLSSDSISFQFTGTDHENDFTRVRKKVLDRFQSGIPSTDHHDLLPAEKRCIAGRTVHDSFPTKFLLSRDIKRPMTPTRSDDDRLGLI